MSADMNGTYIFDQENGFYHRPDAGVFAYSDGEQENTMLKIMRLVKDKSIFSNELLANINSWVTSYHLTPLRSHLLRPFSAYFKGKKVLELGCGCGAITRFLAECGAEVTAVEGSQRGAAIARSRCEGLKNVNIYCDRILDIPFEPASFDCVTLIGVLEYARLFGNGADPVQDTLVKARAMLRPKGTLFLAIENQLGLKYLSGISEDHANAPFFGINDCYTQNSVVTFTRGELDERLKQTGYAGRELFIPLPDYKLVQAMLYPAGLAAAREEFDPTLLVIKNLPPAMSTVGIPIFSIEQASRVMVRGGLTADLANSFLFVAASEPEAAKIVDESILAVHYGNFLHPNYAKQAVFRRSTTGIVVQRSHLHDTGDAAPTAGPYLQTITDEAYAPGSNNMHDALLRALNTPGWNVKDIAEAVRPWIDWLKSCARPDDKGELMLPNEYLDAALTNVVLTPNGPVFIDREWSEGKQVELSFVVFRNIFSSLSMVTSVASPAAGTDPLLAPLVLRTMTINGVRISSVKLREYYERAIALGRQVYGSGTSRKRLEENILLVRPI